MSFRILDQNPVYLNSEGEPVAGGSLVFYESGTTTPKAVFGDPALTINNGSTVALDATGRANVDIWGNGNYRVRLFDALNVQIWQRDSVQADGGGADALPALLAGRFLSNDGAVLSWQVVRQVPDPTGSAGRVLSNDGTNFNWIVLPAAAQPDIVVAANSFRAGITANTTKKFIQTGSGSAPASGNKSTTVAVVFATPFTALEHVNINVTTISATSGGVFVRHAMASTSATGFTVNFSTLTGGTSADNFSSSNITGAVTFTYEAIGTLVVP